MPVKRDGVWWFRQVMQVVTFAAGAAGAWWLARKQKAGGWFWTIIGR